MFLILMHSQLGYQRGDTISKWIPKHIDDNERRRRRRIYEKLI